MPTIPGQLTPSPRLLLGPGPSDAHPRVLTAMTTPLLGHLDPQFLELMNETQEMIRTVYQTKNKMTFPISATGTAGMETCLVNLLEPGDKAVICAKGYFGNRMIDIAGRTGAEVTTLTVPWGQVFDLNVIRETLQKVRPRVLGIVHAETSTGAHQPIEELGKLCHEFNTLLVVDAVTSVGCTPVEVDAWELDAVFTCSQKGLGCPPGLSPITFSERAMDVVRNRKIKCRSWYFDLSLISTYWGGDRAYHHTGPISMVYALREGLRVVLEEGLETRFARHVRNHHALKAGLEAIGLTYTADPAHQLPQLNAVRIPAGIDDVACRKKLLNDFGIEIGGGLGDFKGVAWRIGLMGYNSKPSSVLLVLAAMEQVLKSAGAAIEPGRGVAAAEGVYAQKV
ncbi:pyridoxal-phosphate-dependent aminotransferase family protein [Limnoglobus roseus]|uniref:Alanine--glyoxylate aminotransferase family protein n=1 Tax=Limnoglobus roseus TaxID=2598579 RepID=A0A5C1AFB1_9BACT|nr:alanine--glyoxylate aminotransferase family protein [Limnoglobus roseus]QEL16887.1 alanine--glyoxylate aminotransferase family protein [Limnoglobus roseus]